MATKKVTANKEVKEVVVDEKPVEVAPKKVRYGIVVGGNLNVRKRASLESNVMHVFSKNEKVVILSDKDDLFYKVHTNDGEGYCLKEFIKEDK